MTTQEIATRLHELCLKGDFETAQNELFATDATSTEKNREGKYETITGVEAIKEKGVQFRNMIEEHHGGTQGEAKIFGNHIFLEMGLDVTIKGMGRMNMNEMCQYEVKDGKIISERFFY